MANIFSSFLKRKILRKDQNLISIDEPFDVMANLLKDQQVKGILDAGASDGRESRKLLRKFPDAQVYAFEPNPLYAQALEQYKQQDTRFHPFYLALSDTESQTDLYITESPGCTSLFAPGKSLKEREPKGAAVQTIQKVKTVTIDQWSKNNGEPNIEVMKFDIQGGELKALQGAVHVLCNSTLLVFIEVWFNPAYEGGALFSDIDSYFRKLDYLLLDIFKPKYDSNGLLMWANAIFLNSEKLGMKSK
jgi:FkbM family methyltransferase